MAIPLLGAAALRHLFGWGQVSQGPTQLPTAGHPRFTFAAVAAPLHNPMGSLLMGHY